jgi:hypothetical protein
LNEDPKSILAIDGAKESLLNELLVKVTIWQAEIRFDDGISSTD